LETVTVADPPEEAAAAADDLLLLLLPHAARQIAAAKAEINAVSTARRRRLGTASR
jgi:hypothetical protein